MLPCEQSQRNLNSDFRFSTSMSSLFPKAILSFLSHIIGTDEERGIKMWRKIATAGSGVIHSEADVYSIAFLQKYFDQWAISKYLPFCPPFKLNRRDEVEHAKEEQTEPPPSFTGFDNVAMEDEKTSL